MSTTPRSPRNQKLHDTILITLQTVYEKAKGANEVFVNAGESKNSSIKGHYPDVIAQYTGKPPIVFEIETDETVNEAEVLQWKSFQEAFGLFYLNVPAMLESKAIQILTKNNLSKIIVTGYRWKENKLVFTNKLP